MVYRRARQQGQGRSGEAVADAYRFYDVIETATENVLEEIKKCLKHPDPSDFVGGIFPPEAGGKNAGE